MPKRLSKKKAAEKKDINQLAAEILQAAIEQAKDGTPAKNPAAVFLGRLGGLKGGKARAKRLTAEERSSIARRAAKARWSKLETDDDQSPVNDSS